ncbi:MAG: phosphate signaling complex protein PhoU [Candidatus Delongbacteria bacterium]|nr:phosphate signaling complex protein PhoU [Candidatus Delongbacteria bacterium]
MERHFEKELEILRSTLIRMGTRVEESYELSVRAFCTRNPSLAARVIENDPLINQLEIEIDTIILNYLALKQPVAIDLRFLFSAQKMNKDLERIGDHAVNIAQAAIHYSEIVPIIPSLLEIPRMIELTRHMLHQALESFIHYDSTMAREVLVQDDQIDEWNDVMSREIIEIVKNDAASIEVALDLLSVSKNLERIADLSTNIAEDVIFYAQARNVSHHRDDEKSKNP